MEVKNYVIVIIDKNNKTTEVFKNTKSFIKHYYLFYERYGITESMLPNHKELDYLLRKKIIVEIIGSKDILKIRYIPIF